MSRLSCGSSLVTAIIAFLVEALVAVVAEALVAALL